MLQSRCTRRRFAIGIATAVPMVIVTPTAFASKVEELPPVLPLTPIEVLVSGYDSPEGPAFDKDGNFYFVNWLSSDIVRVDPTGQASVFFNTGGIPAGLAFHPDGSLFVADEGDDIHGILRISSDGKSEIVVNTYNGANLNGANDLVFDRNGTLYFSDPWGSWVDNPIGSFYRLHPDGNLEQIDTGFAFCNGVALTADESAVILAETGKDRLLRYEINSDGTIGTRTEWAITTQPSGPDGMAFDADGRLYVAHYGGYGVDIFGPDGGEAIGKIDVPGAFVTNCAFGGPDNDWLHITDVATASVYRVQLNVKGQPLNDGRDYA